MLFAPFFALNTSCFLLVVVSWFKGCIKNSEPEPLSTPMYSDADPRTLKVCNPLRKGAHPGHHLIPWPIKHCGAAESAQHCSRRGGLCRCGSAADLALEALEELPGTPENTARFFRAGKAARLRFRVPYSSAIVPLHTVG